MTRLSCGDHLHDLEGALLQPIMDLLPQPQPPRLRSEHRSDLVDPDDYGRNHPFLIGQQHRQFVLLHFNIALSFCFSLFFSFGSNRTIC